MAHYIPGSDRVVLQRESGPVRNDSRNLEIMDLLIYHDSRQESGVSAANECARFVYCQFIFISDQIHVDNETSQYG